MDTQKLKPSDLKNVSPWNSVDQKSEYESHMCWIVNRLSENGDKWRELSYEEYKQYGGGDREDILKHYNRYIKSADTIVLYSPSYQQAANKFKII